ncbi:MAG: COX15/CtaA family protein, partial [Candidatus Zixiibacteriota bacterium]
LLGLYRRAIHADQVGLRGLGVWYDFGEIGGKQHAYALLDFAVQFVHRTLGWLILIAVIAFWVYLRRLPLTRLQRIGAHHLLGAAMLQFALGVLTLVLAVPPHLAATHQFGALALFAAALFVTYCLSSANSHRPDTLITADGGSD